MTEAESRKINSIKEQIKETETDIRVLNERIKSMEGAREKISSEYEGKKNEFEEFKRQYAQQSTYGLYFLAVSFIAFVYIAVKVLNHSMVTFMIIPAAVLLAVGIAGRVMGDRKFQSMKKQMIDVEMSYTEVKDKYDTFMEGYNADVRDLEKKQYAWELAENDMIEAKKDAWIAEKKRKAATAAAQA